MLTLTMAKILMIVMMTMMKMVWFTWDETRLGCSNHFWIDQAATEKLKFKLKVISSKCLMIIQICSWSICTRDKERKD